MCRPNRCCRPCPGPIAGSDVRSRVFRGTPCGTTWVRAAICVSPRILRWRGDQFPPPLQNMHNLSICVGLASLNLHHSRIQTLAPARHQSRATAGRSPETHALVRRSRRCSPDKVTDQRSYRGQSVPMTRQSTTPPVWDGQPQFGSRCSLSLLLVSGVLRATVLNMKRSRPCAVANATVRPCFVTWQEALAKDPSRQRGSKHPEVTV